MMELSALIASYGDDDPSRFVVLADHFMVREDRAAAAAAIDRAFGLAPRDRDIALQRAAILDDLALEEHGLRWRYVPAGTFLMGSVYGDPDERPVHPRTLAAFWITDVPISWHRYSELRGWGRPGLSSRERDSENPLASSINIGVRWRYNHHDHQPMIAASTGEAEQLAAHLTSVGPARYGLPSEPQWEKAARGGLVGAQYSWGDDPPTSARCDFERMGDYQLLDPRGFPANGYGLYSMCGGVSERTSDIYDALAYRRAAQGDFSPPPVNEPERVLRGGSWVDCAQAVTVSYRMSRGDRQRATPTIGFRLIRTY